MKERGAGATRPRWRASPRGSPHAVTSFDLNVITSVIVSYAGRATASLALRWQYEIPQNVKLALDVLWYAPRLPL